MSRVDRWRSSWTQRFVRQSQRLSRQPDLGFTSAVVQQRSPALGGLGWTAGCSRHGASLRADLHCLIRLLSIDRNAAQAAF